MRYRCDQGHDWLIRRDENEPECPEDQLCQEGHAAVTCRIEKPVDDVQVLLSPAARIVDDVKGQRILNDRYLLSLLDKTGAEPCSSQENYSWDEVVKLAFLFKGKSVEDALRWWGRRKP
jgi:hypothetical protein